MKIVYCIPALDHPGGMERVLTEKVNYLSSTYGYDISIIITEGEGEVFFPLLDSIKVENFHLNFNSHFSKNVLFKFLFHNQKIYIYKRKLETYLAENQIDICVSLCGKEIEFLSSLKDGSKKVAEIHFAQNFRKHFLLSLHSGLLWKVLGSIRTWQLKQTTKSLDKLVVLTQQDFIQWIKTHKNVVVIPNPSPLTTKEVANINNKRIISVGKLDAQKGFDLLINAWKIVSEKHPDWILNIFGKGELHSRLQNQISSLNLDNFIHLKGTCTEIFPQYLDHSVYVMSSRYEGLPMVLIEAMECGLPLVSFDCECGPKDVIKDGQNGFLVPLGNISILANRICELIESKNKRSEMGKKSKEMATAYQIDKIMKDWITLFSNL